MKILLVPLVLYLLFALMVYISQRKLIYYPASTLPTTAQLQENGLRIWPSDERYLGFTSNKTTGDEHALVVFFHGNASLAHDRAELAASLSESGFRVLLAEYPGYGHRPGELSEESIISDAVDTVVHAANRFDLPVYLWGESLGSGVAAGVVSALQQRQSPVVIQGVVLQAPFDSLVNVAQHHYWYLPVRWLLKDRFDSTDHLKDYHGPVAILAAENDTVIPTDFAVNLYESLDTTKELWVVEGASHAFAATSKASWWREVIDFIKIK